MAVGIASIARFTGVAADLPEGDDYVHTAAVDGRKLIIARRYADGRIIIVEEIQCRHQASAEFLARAVNMARAD